MCETVLIMQDQCHPSPARQRVHCGSAARSSRGRRGGVGTDSCNPTVAKSLGALHWLDMHMSSGALIPFERRYNM